MSSAPPMESPMSAKTPKPRVVLVSLDPQSYFEAAYRGLLIELKSKATVEVAKTPNLAIKLLVDEPLPSVILITDAALTLDHFEHVWAVILNCVRQGCTSVVMGLFPGFAYFDKFRPFFSRAGLSWSASKYQTGSWTVNQAATGSDLAAGLPARYYQKAVSVYNVAFSDAWYTTPSTPEPYVVNQRSSNSYCESAVAMARVGDGNLGYVGLTNSKKEAYTIVLAMCNFPIGEYFDEDWEWDEIRLITDLQREKREKRENVLRVRE
ncbi:hypothetical protein N7456_005246 [Penicillium angulare]|uniref:Uncharacterized protein n=1 Tax=Penicillium angulare TaxID=116970 RepID=A0A9W9KJZ4_9EURO|nr:hypothetical protein N7456_005246 [Penicillium angulare]